MKWVESGRALEINRDMLGIKGDDQLLKYILLDMNSISVSCQTSSWDMNHYQVSSAFSRPDITYWYSRFYLLLESCRIIISACRTPLLLLLPPPPTLTHLPTPHSHSPKTQLLGDIHVFLAVTAHWRNYPVGSFQIPLKVLRSSSIIG